ncbi:MAG: NAD(P)/FAD-dependent oxidoreductase [Krumholzibacteria bacterium]|nr:NAD(P)/FAD-dependent oxidoreductase [Candidatus Krumholzibacteria bacterium]
MPDVAVTIVGGGIVGCAVADAAARAGRSVVLLEQEQAVGRGTTSRNSEVAHGGMYYPTGSLKARFCVEGRHLLKAFSAEAGLGWRECGKLIVAVEADEIPALQQLHALGLANGVEDLQLLEPQEVSRLEPGVRAAAALISPRTAVCDAEGLARGLARRAAAHGAQVLCGARVTALARDGVAWRVTVAADSRREGWSHTSGAVVNAAGLYADQVAALAGIDVEARGWRQVLVRGSYFRIAPRHRGRVGRLVYPLPPTDGSTLGAHLCLDLGEGLRLGPDFAAPLPPGSDPALIAWAVDAARADAFHQDAVRFLPWLERDDLTPDMSGMRPKLAAHGFRDFVADRGEGELAGLVNLVGIDSPGLTASMALARHVVDELMAA